MNLADGELDRLVARARSGEALAAETVDQVLVEAGPAATEEVTESLRRTLVLAQGEERTGLGALQAQIEAFPSRTLARSNEGGTETTELARRIDVAFAVLRADASARRLALATELAGARAALDGGALLAHQALQSIAEATLLRDERESIDALRTAFHDAADGLCMALVDALRAEATSKRLAALVDLLGVRRSSDGAILNRVHGMAVRLGPVLDELSLRRIRPYLEVQSDFERMGAAQCVGALEDRAALGTLVALLRDADASVRNASHDSLRQISAMTIGPSPDRWRSWLGREETWWVERGSLDLARLPSAERVEALAILREAAQHRLFRDEIASATLPLLGSNDPTLVRMALATLEAVRARNVGFDVVELLEHPSATVRTQAASCLRNLTGRMLPPDPALWRQVLRP